jgi:hypothetical protein
MVGGGEEDTDDVFAGVASDGGSALGSRTRRQGHMSAIGVDVPPTMMTTTGSRWPWARSTWSVGGTVVVVREVVAGFSDQAGVVVVAGRWEQVFRAARS